MPVKSKNLIRGECAIEEYQEYFLRTQLLTGFSRKTSIAWLMESGSAPVYTVFGPRLPRHVEMSGNLSRIKNIEEVLRDLSSKRRKEWRAVMLDRVYSPEKIKSADERAALLKVGKRWYYQMVERGLRFIGERLKT